MESDDTVQFHYREYDGTPYTTFTTGALLLFFIPYFFTAAYTSGSFVPAGLFVPTLTAGAGFGRIIGHLLNTMAPGYVADSGSYALIGAAAMLGGMARMTIAGTVIVLEACGNSNYLLPLMITFAAARYTGNAINESLYDMQMKMKQYPFLEGKMPNLGLLNYYPVSEIMSTPVITFKEIEQVQIVYEVLQNNQHNGFPVVDGEGKMRGLVLRKTLTTLLKYRIFSKAKDVTDAAGMGDGRHYKQLSPAATVFYDTMEREYPKYISIEDVRVNQSDLVGSISPCILIVLVRA